MSNEIIEAGVAILVIGGRVISHFEHKKTGRDIMEIKVSINGEVEKRVEQAREEGRQEERNKVKNDI